jgi:hypothetical protein
MCPLPDPPRPSRRCSGISVKVPAATRTPARHQPGSSPSDDCARTNSSRPSSSSPAAVSWSDPADLSARDGRCTTRAMSPSSKPRVWVATSSTSRRRIRRHRCARQRKYDAPPRIRVHRIETTFRFRRCLHKLALLRLLQTHRERTHCQGRLVRSSLCAWWASTLIRCWLRARRQIRSRQASRVVNRGYGRLSQSIHGIGTSAGGCAALVESPPVWNPNTGRWRPKPIEGGRRSCTASEYLGDR